MKNLQQGPQVSQCRIHRVQDQSPTTEDDQVAVEEPLEIRMGFGPQNGRERESVAITMRTPGHDVELAAGFLLTEGLLNRANDIAEITPCGPLVDGRRNVVRVELKPHVPYDPERLKRNFYATSSCGVCGKSSLEALSLTDCTPLEPQGWRIPGDLVERLPDLAREAQDVFAQTGGLHATALFDRQGELVYLREDVGRHNAMDKAVGAACFAGATGPEIAEAPLIAVLSGRASFELLQKALRSRIPLVVAVGAPSSLAVAVAERFGITLIGFARGNRFNIYHDRERIDISPSDARSQ